MVRSRITIIVRYFDGEIAFLLYRQTRVPHCGSPLPLAAARRQGESHSNRKISDDERSMDKIVRMFNYQTLGR